MTLLYENYKNDITVSEIKEGHYCPRDTKMALLSERYKNDITVREQQKWHYCPRNTKNDITFREIQK
jgi:hypothetical protein